MARESQRNPDMRTSSLIKLAIVAAISVVTLAPGRADAECYQYWDEYYWTMYEWCDECGNGVCDATDQWYCPAECATTNRVVYVHGMESSTWPTQGYLKTSSAWSHVPLTYNSNARLTDPTVRDTIRNALINNCATSTPNQCVLISASAGSARLLLALEEINAMGIALRVVWQGHYASAEGGTELANKWTRGLRRLLAKVFGSWSPMVDDLTTWRMRNDFYSMHYAAQQPVYMAAGTRDETIKKFLFWKIKGNTHMPCEQGDGKVPVHSAGGYASIQCNYSLCDGYARFPLRTQTSCATTYTQHIGTIVEGIKGGSVLLAQTAYFGSCEGLTDSPEPEASTADDTADYAGQGGATICDESACLNGGQAVCQPAELAKTVDTSPSAGGVCGDWVCTDNEWSTCLQDCCPCCVYYCGY